MRLPQIVLASSSVYRKAILERSGLKFTTASPDIDESPGVGESAEQMVERLATAKARALAGRFPEALIIGSDQVAQLNGEISGKSHDAETAFRQIKAASGNTVTLVTGLALLNVGNGHLQTGIDRFEVTFRDLGDREIRKYIELEKPFDCCGSVKAEGPGIALLSRLHGNDPNTLIGLPLIMLIDMLGNEGITLF